ncbi:hypothetical protein GF325_04165 [Candidatus Bathyarchaeota archaeon]|nr:hypothetical protein [Candidatus Bathyarchaeota archaeon]
MQPPGYSKSLCQEILSHGHEIGFHFDAISNAGKKKTLKSMSRLWSFTELERQLKTLQKHTGAFPLYTNKNHYTRWEGRTEFLEWCEELGIRVDQTKGPSKCGTQGFPFGSCHPWQAMNIDGKLIGCLEISFQSQDFGLQGPEDTMDILLDGVVKAAGVAHVIFHPAHATKPRVNALMHEFITKCKELGASFMKSRDIGEWVFKRKLAIAKGIQDLDGASIKERDPRKKDWVPITTNS